MEKSYNFDKKVCYNMLNSYLLCKKFIRESYFTPNDCAEIKDNLLKYCSDCKSVSKIIKKTS